MTPTYPFAIPNAEFDAAVLRADDLHGTPGQHDALTKLAPWFYTNVKVGKVEPGRVQRWALDRWSHAEPVTEASFIRDVLDVVPCGVGVLAVGRIRLHQWVGIFADVDARTVRDPELFAGWYATTVRWLDATAFLVRGPAKRTTLLRAIWLPRLKSYRPRFRLPVLWGVIEQHRRPSGMPVLQHVHRCQQCGVDARTTWPTDIGVEPLIPHPEACEHFADGVLLGVGPQHWRRSKWNCWEAAYATAVRSQMFAEVTAMPPCVN